ncbi:MAG: HNH endonuclease [Elainellaceae cyanobacterium]
MATYIPVDLRNQIRATDGNCCCYCQTSEILSGIRMSFDHIRPRSKGGETCFDNVCLACRSCNEFKGDCVTAQDLITQQRIPLFNPRLQRWHDHFVWSDDGTTIEARTAVGRVTVLALRMNHAAIVSARKRWVSVGWHPPKNTG